MNIYTVSRATQGLADYLIEESQKQPHPKGHLARGVVIAHDCRHKSHEFSETIALVLNANNIKTYVSATILRLVEEEKLSINDPIKKLLSNKTRTLFEGAGYNLNAIKVKHLLSHTSGIQNYANQEYVDFINHNKKHRWTRDDQLALTIRLGSPLGKPGFTFSYTDANYLMCTEIIETIERKPFYTAMRELLRYETLDLDNTWFPHPGLRQPHPEPL